MKFKSIESKDGQPNATSSRSTRFLGLCLALGVPILILFAFVFSPKDDTMDDAVRLLYVHVPVAIFSYIAFGVTAMGSIFYLWKQSRWWDTTAHASA